MKLNIRQLYLYLVSIISLVIVMIGAVSLIDLGFKVYVFKGADRIDYTAPAVIPEKGQQLTPEQQKALDERQRIMQDKETIRQRQMQFSNSVAMILVGGAVYWFHQRMIKKDKKR